MFVIDPGHGGCDTGSTNIINSNLLVKESDLNLSLALLLYSDFQEHNIPVILTRCNDTLVSIEDRISIANKSRAKYFISIHHNFSRNEKVTGSETLVYSLKKMLPPLRLMASCLSKSTGFIDRGIIERKDICVLRKTKMNSILFEIGFLSNEKECLKCNDINYQTNLSKKLTNNIMKAIGWNG